MLGSQYIHLLCGDIIAGTIHTINVLKTSLDSNK